MDSTTGKDYSHRKVWLMDRLKQLVPCFGINLEAYAIMSNHFHLVVDFDPRASARWSNEELVDRWLTACPPKKNGQPDALKRALRFEALLLDPKELERLRRELGSLSTFMKWLKQPISRRANIEDGCKGHFFEQRFWSGAILDERALLASMAYVDLNPVRAKLADRIEDCQHTSIQERLTAQPLTPKRLAESLLPLVTGLEETSEEENETTSLAGGRQHHRLRITLADYIALLETQVSVTHSDQTRLNEVQRRWINELASLRRKQRAYGELANLKTWLEHRALRPLEKSLPA